MIIKKFSCSVVVSVLLHICAGGCVSFLHGCSYPAAIVFDYTRVVLTGNAGW